MRPADLTLRLGVPRWPVGHPPLFGPDALNTLLNSIH